MIFCIPLPSFKGIVAPFRGIFAIGYSQPLFLLLPSFKRIVAPFKGLFAIGHSQPLFLPLPSFKGIVALFKGHFAIGHSQPLFLFLPLFKGIVDDDDVCILIFFIVSLFVSWLAFWKFLVILDFYSGTHFFMSMAIHILISLRTHSSTYSFLCFCGNMYACFFIPLLSMVIRTHFFAFEGINTHFFCFYRICKHFLLLLLLQYMHLFLYINTPLTLFLLEQRLYYRK